MERQDGGVSLDAAFPAFVLQTFCSCQRGWIEGTVTERLAHLAHVTLHHQQKRSAGVLEEMPTIGHLNGLRSAIAAPAPIAAAVAGDNLDARPAL